jgi:hypothetical protein
MDMDARVKPGHDKRIESAHYAACPIRVASAAACCMPFDISLVTAFCSSTAAAVDVTFPLTSWIAFVTELKAWQRMIIHHNINSLTSKKKMYYDAHASKMGREPFSKCLVEPLRVDPRGRHCAMDVKAEITR